MVSKIVIDLLSEEETDLPVGKKVTYIDETFISHRSDGGSSHRERRAEARLSTRKKLEILDWASMDSQLRSYGSNKIGNLPLELIGEDVIEHVTNQDSVFDFRSDSIPFAVKYNVAMALSYSEAIDILSQNGSCEIYASAEVERVFRKYNKGIYPGLNRIDFYELPLDMQKELIWPMVQNLYRGLTIRKAAKVFPEGIPGELAYKALLTECENAQLAGYISDLDVLKYGEYERVYFSNPSDLEIKYQVALYCLNHIGEIKPTQETPKEEPAQEDEPKKHDEKQQEKNYRTIEEEYISAFKRLNKNKSFWDNINLSDIFQMGQDVILAIKEEVRDFAQLKQGIISRLLGRSTVAIENEELVRIMRSQNPDFGFVSQYLAMFFQPSDYYDILELDDSRVVTEKDIKDAFKRQAKIYHPDKNSNDPNKNEKEQRFKMLMAAKDALLRKLGTGKEITSGFREDISLARYLGNISKLFGDPGSVHENIKQEESEVPKIEHEEEIKVEPNYIGDDVDEPFEDYTVSDQDILQYQEVESLKNTYQDQNNENISEDSETTNEYLGPYFEEMRLLESMIDGWASKRVLIVGAGREPDDFSIPVILSRMGANVSATDVNYRGPAEYEGCQYFRVSADRIGNMFPQEQFDIVISTAMFGVPFTNWAAREFGLNTFDESFKDRIRELELEVLGKLLNLTKKGGIHFHYNRDLNPQSWNFGEGDLKRIGCESAFHPENLLNSRGTWFLRK